MALPIGFVIAQRSILYDGIRHFLFVIPPLSVLCAATFFSGLDRIRMPGLRWAGIVLIGVYALYHAGLMLSLHPYQYVYFNRFAGGLSGASGRFETDYWGHSYAEATRKLERYLEETQQPGVYAVYVCGPEDAATYYFGERLRLAADVEGADFFLAYTRYDCREKFEAPVVVEVARRGATLARVKDLRPLRSPGGR